MNSKKIRLAVIGHPIDHSLSPIIHQEFASEFNLNIDYQKLKVKVSDLSSYLSFLGKDYLGFNVTSPLKNLVASSISNKVIGINSINTLIRYKGQTFGYNTDGRGLINDFINKNIKLKNKKIIILGTGGVVSSILPSMINCSPLQITIIGRTLEKSKKIIESLAVLSSLKNKSLSLLCPNFYDSDNVKPLIENSDLLINATSAGLSNKLPKLPTNIELSKVTCLDLNYGANASPFNEWAKNNNAPQVFDGIGMLVEQAALSFKIWFNHSPNTKFVIEKLNSYSII